MSDKQHTKKFDSRCPRQLECAPDSWCGLAVQRLKALRFAGKELTEEQEDEFPGCKWATQNQMANYCFFKLADDLMPDAKGFSDMEIAHFLNVSVDTVKKTEKRAVAKMKDSNDFQEMVKTYSGDKILED